jgi:methylornithine synthase
MNNLESILNKAISEIPLENNEIRDLLNINTKSDKNALFQTARTIRNRNFGNKIFLYGFLYISTYCKNDCNFCSFRRSNRETLRYRKEASEIVEAAQKLFESGVHLIDLTMGDDPYYLSNPGLSYFMEIIKDIKKKTGLPVMVSPGVAPDEFLLNLADAGVSWYACYQETHNKTLFARLRKDQDYDERLNTKVQAHKLGMLIEEGILAGVGETPDNIVQSMETMRLLESDQVRVMHFVPDSSIPLKSFSGSISSEPLIIAVLRLLFPDRLIPASLDVEGINGLEARLMAGANVVTSIVPPGRGLSGVAHSSLDIETGKRSVGQVLEIAMSCGLEQGSQENYEAWIDSRKKSL